MVRRYPACMSRNFVRFVLHAALLAPLACGCSAHTQKDPKPSSAPVASESSVRPGINDEYKKKDLNVDEWAGKFESESREIFTQRLAILAASGVKPGMAVGDIGAGTGFMTELFSNTVGPSGRVYAVDITPAFLERIRTRATQQQRTNIVTVLGKEDSVELPPRSIDLAFICDTYHHFEYPRTEMASIHRALRPGGTLVVIDFIRKEGVSRPWILEHVRAGQETVTQELIASGFEPLNDPPANFLKENYLIRFCRP